MKIGFATNQSLEYEEIAKSCMLHKIIHSKLSGTILKYFSDVTLQMSNLLSSLIHLEKGPMHKVRIRIW